MAKASLQQAAQCQISNQAICITSVRKKVKVLSVYLLVKTI